MVDGRSGYRLTRLRRWLDTFFLPSPSPSSLASRPTKQFYLLYLFFLKDLIITATELGQPSLVVRRKMRPWNMFHVLSNYCFHQKKFTNSNVLVNAKIVVDFCKSTEQSRRSDLNLREAKLFYSVHGNLSGTPAFTTFWHSSSPDQLQRGEGLAAGELMRHEHCWTKGWDVY